MDDNARPGVEQRPGSSGNHVERLEGAVAAVLVGLGGSALLGPGGPQLGQAPDGQVPSMPGQDDGPQDGGTDSSNT